MTVPGRAIHPSLADLVNAPELGLDCVSGHGELHRPVTWVHVAEVNDPSPWLSRGVLLLTTGLVERDAAELEAFFAGLAAHGVAAVGFGVGLIVDEIPESWILAAGRHRMPLLRIPLRTPYIAISAFVSQRIGDAQMNQVRRMLDVQQRLAYAEAGREPGVEALETLGAELDAAVLWTGADGTPVRTAAGGVLTSDELRTLAGELARHAASGRRGTSFSAGTLYAHLASTAGAPIAVVRRRRYTPLEQSIIGSIAVFIDLVREGEAPRDPATSFRERVLGEAVSGRLAADARLWELLMLQAERCAVVRLGPSPDPAVPSRREPAAGLLLRAHLASALSAVGASVAPLLCSTGSGFLLALPDADAASARDAVAAFLETETGNLRTWRAGVSRTGAPAELLELCAEAERARRATRHRPGALVLAHAELSRRELLGDWLPPALESPVVAQWRRRLAATDPETAARVREALRAFLGANGAIERAAAELGVHRQTLHARLRTAERVLGLELDAPTERALLWLALDAGELGPAPVRDDARDGPVG
ncbi:PucR family transcriptional regulator [Leucobacter allii]|uniref:PucR family transcriptional regulator n=1 Tax=Leucobacter allii TaxID=2932247 RepID=A0ABY4FJ71_9MICO|nr:PucR family transcriptional regulator [Leucobacter allii]UOQ56022.1 PucR family transcriptional regulator [Leucobacter allii]UOR00540.1 PucR family transcriptional regulator [Leucobacter allii]